MTSIEWLDEQITICFENYSGTTLSQRIYDKIEQAKEIHKQEIIKAYDEGDCFAQDYHNGADYYKKNY